MSDYDKECRRKVQGAIEAAKLNGYQSDLRIETVGANPSHRMTIPAYVLERLLNVER